SVRSTEELVALGETTPERRRSPRVRPANPRSMELSELLSDCLDTRVKVDIGRHKGKITIEFAGEEDLDRILVALQEMTDLS
ncbi:MAG: chromosome partitioning protein ParB, partial [Propionibacteriaceae bacterium]|nr:chromosome partitioning protein ParB [Propionibacteriaceae bacterium]